MDKLEKRPRAIGLTTEVREGSPVTRSAFTNYVLDDRALLHGSMKTGVEAHCGAHVCSAGSWMEEGKLSVVTDTTGESLVSGGDGDEATTRILPRPFVLSTKVKYLGRVETYSHVGLPKGFKAVGCMDIFREKDSEQDRARKGVDYVVVTGTSVRKGSAKEFDIHLLGGAEKISNGEITRDRSNGALELLQMLKMFDMKVEGWFAITPFANYFKSFPERCPRLPRGNEMSVVPYACAGGPPRYAMVCYRFDLAYAVFDKSIMSNSGKQQLDAEKWIFEYL